MEEVRSEYINLREAALILGFSETWVHKKARAGILPHIRIGRVLRFTKRDLDAWMNGHRVKGCLKV